MSRPPDAQKCVFELQLSFLVKACQKSLYSTEDMNQMHSLSRLNVTEAFGFNRR